MKTEQEWQAGLIEIYGRPLTAQEQAAAQERRNTWLARDRTVLLQTVKPDGSFEYLDTLGRRVP
jgi:hypothetical protein